MHRPATVIGIDAGATKTVALLADEAGAVLRRAKGRGANLVLHGELEVEKTLHAVIEELTIDAPVTSLCIGIAGADRPGEGELVASILERLGTSKQVHVVNDAHAALVAGAPAGVGIVVVAGTGSIAFGIDSEGTRARSGGWGYLLGDEGSAFWIGHAAVRLGIRAIDGRGPSTTLFDRICQHLALADAQDLVEWFYNQDNPRIHVAGLAFLVEAAAIDGDAPAEALLDQAAHHLALATEAVKGQLQLDSDDALVLAGGAFKACPSLVKRIDAALPLGTPSPLLLAAEPANGAVTIALQRRHPSASLLPFPRRRSG